MTNVLLFSWDRSLPGREQLSAQHFQDFMGYMQQQKTQGHVESFEPVLLEPHGTGMHGFFLIKAAPDKLNALIASPDWLQHQTRAMLHLEGASVVRGVAGAGVAERMAMWSGLIPK